MKMNNKGQITIFIIVGIIILFAAGMIFYLTSQGTKEQKIEIPTEFENINLFVDSCVKQIAKTAVQDLSLNGGYYFIKRENVDLGYSQPMYYVKNNAANQPSRKTLESELAVYAENELVKCVNNFEGFDKTKYKFEYGNPKAAVELNAEDVRVNVDFPIKILYDEKTFEMSRFSSTVRARLGYMSSIAGQIVNSSLKNPGMVDFTLIDSFSDVKINVEGFNDSVLVYSIDDEKVLIDGLPLILMFAVESNTVLPHFEINNSYILKENQLFTLGLNPNKKVEFYSSDALVNVTDEGNLTIKTEIVGDFNVTIRAIDSENRVFEREVLFKIEK